MSRPRRRPSRRPGTDVRAQATLASLALALVALTAVASVGVVVADDALADADRAPEQRRLARGLSDRLVAADAPLTHRANVLSADRIAGLNASRIETLVPAVRGLSFAVRLDGRTLASHGTVAGATTIRRIVLVGDPRPTERTVSLGDATTLPRTDRVDVTLSPSGNTSVVAVRVNGRIVRYDAEGLARDTTLNTTRRPEPTVSFETANGTAGTATLTSYPLDADAGRLEVTVDA
jgi:hypothetical protein